MLTLSITFGSLLAFAAWELYRPRRRLEFPALQRRLANIGIWLFNIILAGLIFVQPDQMRAPWHLAPWLSFPLGFLILDFLIYAVHRALHAVPLLWRLHALHHSDPDPDVTTAVRHHPIENLMTTAFYWFVIVVIGTPGPVIAAHAATVFVLAVATHANTTCWPRWIERLLRPVVITLDLHLMHHSAAAEHYNTNYGAVFSFWDRLFGTLRRADTDQLRFGVDDLPGETSLGLIDQLATPWRLRRVSPAWRSPADIAMREIEEHKLKYWKMF
jgi:sterol desaturase/sphingolipid hydroxylase (fatty acid hydroxylase superfamily)